MNFKQICKILDDAKVAYSLEHEYKDGKPIDLELFRSIQLPFTPEIWCNICMTDGEFYVGGCCGQTSDIQDDINDIFRMESGWIDIKKLADISEKWIYHDSDSSFFHKDGWKKEFGEAFDLQDIISKGEPWNIMACLWHLVKDFYRLEVSHALRKDMPEIQKAISVLYRCFMAISWEKMFKEEVTGQKKAGRSLMLSRVLPALKTFNEQFDQLDYGILDGFGIYEIEKDGIASNGFGLCVYESEQEAQDLIDQWQKDQDEGAQKRLGLISEKFEVRPVRVSKEKGLEQL